MLIPFKKYEASGNDFIVVDEADLPGMTQEAAELLLRKAAPHWCDRHFGIGGDGILLIGLADDCAGAPASMIIVNADGTAAGMCGNGIRCAAAEWERRYRLLSRGELRVSTRGGIQRVCAAPFADGQGFAVDIAKCAFARSVSLQTSRRIWNGDEIDVGNPHAVFETAPGGMPPDEALAQFGAQLSSHCAFADRANIEFIREIAPNRLEMRVYERGVGPTLSCGTGCVASAFAYCRRRRITGARISIETPGGELQVDIPEGIDFSPVSVQNAGGAAGGAKPRLIGTAHFVYSGAAEAPQA